MRGAIFFPSPTRRKQKTARETKKDGPKRQHKGLVSTPHVSIHKAAQLIRLFSESIEVLKLKFYSSVDCAAPLVDAVRITKSLKELVIESNLSGGSSNLAKILDATPNLEKLKIGYTGVPPMEFSESALTKLRYLNFVYENVPGSEMEEEDDFDYGTFADLSGIVNICQKAKTSLKVIECYAAEESGSGLLPVLTAVQETVEGLFTGSMCHQWPGDALLVECPLLRVVSTSPWDAMCLYGAGSNAFDGWFGWPILRHARTLVFHIEYSLDSWLHFFKSARQEKLFKPSTTSRDEGLFRELPNLKQCLFRNRDDAFFPVGKVPESLIEDFEAYGIKCLAIDNLDPDEIMVSLFSISPRPLPPMTHLTLPCNPGDISIGIG